MNSGIRLWGACLLFVAGCSNSDTSPADTVDTTSGAPTTVGHGATGHADGNIGVAAPGGAAGMLTGAGGGSPADAPDGSGAPIDGPQVGGPQVDGPQVGGPDGPETDGMNADADVTDEGDVDDAPGDPTPADGADSGPADCPAGDDVRADVRAVIVTGPDGEPKKGDTLSLDVVVQNDGSEGGMIELTALVDSQRFSDFSGVPLANTRVMLCPGEQHITLSGGPFLSDPLTDKHYALGRGDYRLSAMEVRVNGADAARDETFDGAAFSLAASAVLLVPVIYDQAYFDRIEGEVESPEAYMQAIYSRPGSVFTPVSDDPDGDGDFQQFERGFDEMMGVRHRFRTFPGFVGGDEGIGGWCENAGAYAVDVLGLQAQWDGSGTRPEHHGFDYLIALTPNMGGGVACGWLDVQVSSLINQDLDRQQVIAVHESGHLFGAPHCDDRGNGEGGSLQGYVMCSGEKHARYPSEFVWHSTSREQMGSHWD